MLVAAASGQEARAPIETGLVRAVELESLPGTFVQHFRLEPARATASGDAVGVGRYLAGPDPEGGLRVELELVYFEGDVRVFQCERATLSERKLVFREVRPAGGRTLFLTGSPSAGYECQELAGGEALRRVLSDAGEFPLFLVESARRGLALPGEAQVFEPLAAQPERGTVAFVAGESLALRRSDGSLRFAVRFEAGAPVEWRWNERAPVARAISRAEYEELRSPRGSETPAVAAGQ